VSSLAPDLRGETLRRNVRRIRSLVEAAQERSPASAPQVALVVVTKSVSPELFAPLVAAGVREVGENRVQSAARRKALAPPGLIWHGIGHLQRNKAQTALQTFDRFHALDSLRLAERLEALLAPQERCWPVFLQINAAEDAAKGGVRPQEAEAFLQAILARPHLQPLGFMTIGKLGAEKEEVRSTFRTLREIRDESLRRGRGALPARELSMGMSDDFEMAVEEGASVIRVGRAVFRDVPTIANPAAFAAGPHQGGEGAGGELS